MTTDELIETLQQILYEADRLNSGNVAHKRAHIITGIQLILDDLNTTKIKK
jgi:hypothetical protein